MPKVKPSAPSGVPPASAGAQPSESLTAVASSIEQRDAPSAPVDGGNQAEQANVAAVTSRDGTDEQDPAGPPASSEALYEQVQTELVKARVLADCAYGKCNDVVEIDVVQAEALRDVLDTSPAAVTYALSLGSEQ